MSARRRRKACRTYIPPDPDDAVELWWRAVELRTEWLNHGLCTASADRPAAEDAVTGLYALLGLPRPRFVWVASPTAALRIVPPSPDNLAGDPLCAVENRLATLVSSMRQRMDRRVGVRRDWDVPQLPSDPLVALGSGATLRSVVDTGVHDVLRRAVRESVAGMIWSTLAVRLGLMWLGQHDADWVAYYDIHHRVAGARFDDVDLQQLQLWAVLARSCGWWWPRDGVCVMSERPSALSVEPVPGDANGMARLHNATGPAVEFPDGTAVHSWHGTCVPAWVIDAPSSRLIAVERNIEVRRCAIERIGWAAFIDQAGLTLVSRSADPGNPGCELRLYTLPYERWGSPTRLLLAVNGSVERDGTRRSYGLRVPPWFDDPIAAAGWSYGLSGAQYARLQRRT